MTRCSLLLVYVALFAEYTRAQDPGWGTIRGQVTCDFFEPVGPHPRFDPNRDTLCPHSVLDESLIIDETTRGLKNVLVFARRAPSRIHPKLQGSISREVVLSVKACRIEPHIVAVWRQHQTFFLVNEDRAAHLLMGDPGTPSAISKHLRGESEERFEYGRFQRARHAPFGMWCTIHPWMEAYCLPLDSPYFVVTDGTGKFNIPDLPAGEDLELSIWHERYRFISPAGRQERTPLTLKLTAGEVREIAPIELLRPVDE